MNRLLQLLAMPWVATPLTGRILAGLVLAFQLLAVIVAAAMAPMKGTWHLSQPTVLLMGFAIWMWSAMSSANLQLARNARELCLPKIVRDSNLSLLALWGVGVALPAIVCIALGAPWFATSVFFVFAAAIALVYMLLPFYLGLPLTIGVFFLALMHGPAALASAWTPITWLWPTGVALTVAAWRWSRLRGADAVSTDGWNAPVMFHCYRQDAMRNGGWLGFSQIFLQRRLGVAGRVDFRRIGPDRPVASLRLALGGPAMPKPPVSRLRDAGSLLAYMLVFGLILVVPQAMGTHKYLRSVAAFRLHWIPPLMTYLGVLMCCLGVSLFAGRTRALWCKWDTELPLLALLPGLGNAKTSKQHALLATLIPPAIFLAIVAMVLWVGAFAVSAKPWAYLAVALCCGGALALSTAVTLATLGGKSISIAGYAILYLVMLGFTTWTLIAGLPTDQYNGSHPGSMGVLPVWLLLCWAGFLVLLGCMAYIGWHGLRERPHAFLANTP